MPSQYLRIKPTHSPWALLTRKIQQEGTEVRACILRLYLPQEYILILLSVYFLRGWLWRERAKRPWRWLRRQTPPSMIPSPHSLVTFHSSQLQLHYSEPALYSTEAPVTLQAPTSVSPGLAKCPSRTPLNQISLVQYGTFLQIPNVV